MLGVEKTFSLMGESGVGGMVDFNITVKNDGNVDLVDVALTDAMFQIDGGEISVPTKGVSFQDLYVSTEGFRIYVALMEMAVRSTSRGHRELSVKYMLYGAAVVCHVYSGVYPSMLSVYFSHPQADSNPYTKRRQESSFGYDGGGSKCSPESHSIENIANRFVWIFLAVAA